MAAGVRIRLVRQNLVGVPIRLHHSVLVECHAANRHSTRLHLFDVIPVDADDPWTLASMVVGDSVPAVVRSRVLDKSLTRSGAAFQDIRLTRLPSNVDFDIVVERARRFQADYFDDDPRIQLYKSNCIHFSNSLYNDLLDFFLSSA